MHSYHEGGVGSHSHPRSVNTLLVDPAGNRQVAWLDGAFWPPEGAVVELANPDGDAVVIGVRLQLPPTVDHATILVDLHMPEGDADYIARHPIDREWHG